MATEQKRGKEKENGLEAPEEEQDVPQLVCFPLRHEEEQRDTTCGDATTLFTSPALARLPWSMPPLREREMCILR